MKMYSGSRIVINSTIPKALLVNVNISVIWKFDLCVYFCRGEAAFHAMSATLGWAKHPMVNRIHTLRKDIPITLLYGSRSWVDNASGEMIREKRPDSFVHVQVCRYFL